LLAAVGFQTTKSITNGYGSAVHADSSQGQPGFTAILRGFRRHHDAIEAFSAAASLFVAITVAGFTGLLIKVGRDQHQAAMGALNLAREEFNTTHRPQIIVHIADYLAIPSGPPDNRSEIGASILCFNVGPGLAKNVTTYADILCTNEIATDVLRQEWQTIPVLGSGFKFRAPISSDRTIKDIPNGVRCYCVGTIVYFDAANRRRETGFCFRLVADGKPYWTNTHIPEEFEYAY
jgi:hypothetical protein